MDNLIFFYMFLLSLLNLANSQTYIVHMDISAMPKSFSNHHSWFSATIDSITTTATATSSSSSKLVYSYTNAIHGFTAVLSPSELEIIKRTPGYLSSVRDKTVQLDTTHSTQFLGLNSDYGAWPVANYGKDIIIGVVDTGIWPESGSFNDHGMTAIPSRWKGECESGFHFNSSLCNKKLIGARYFNKGLLSNHENLSLSMNSARDTDGHGTHTSSTAAGSYVKNASYFGYGTGTATGVAPQARLAVYKAVWEEGVFLSDILAAIDQAIIDGVDILSLSLGSDDIPLDKDPIAIATFAAMEKGIFVSTSAGNNGPFFRSLHNGTPWVLTVAASTIDREFTGVLTLGNGVSVMGQALYPGNSSSIQVPMVLVESCEDEKEVNKLDGEFVVCLDKNDTLVVQFYTVQSSNASGAIFITNDTDIEFFIQSTYPVMLLNLQSGQIVIDYIQKLDKGDQAKASMKFHGTKLKTKPAPRMASYSSRGPSYSCPVVLKPDITAPGSLILASWPDNISPASIKAQPEQLFSKFNILSGTSMSCPHASGLAALIKTANPDWSPSAIRSAMMTTSDILDNTFKPIQDIGDNNNPATPLAMGSGHIAPNKALYPGLIYEVEPQDYVNLLCGLNYTIPQIQTITRSIVNCSNPTLDINYPSFIAYFNVNDTKSDRIMYEFTRMVTYVGDRRSSTFTAKLTAVGRLNVSVSPEKLSFRSKNEKKMYKLRIEGPSRMEEEVVFGFLSWIGSKEKVEVRSPIVATTLQGTADTI